MHPKEVFKQFGAMRAFQLIGFCQLWRSLGAPHLPGLAGAIRTEMESQGLSKSAAYRYIAELRQWNEELGREPDELDDLAHQVAAVFDVKESTEDTFPCMGNPATIKQVKAEATNAPPIHQE